MNKFCSTSEKTENACASLSLSTSLAILCMLKDREKVSQSEIDLFTGIILTDDATNLPGFIQVISESKSQGCSL